MTWIETTARNVSAALRESLNAEATLKVHMGLSQPVVWGELDPGDARVRILKGIIAAVEHLATAQDQLKELMK